MLTESLPEVLEIGIPVDAIPVDVRSLSTERYLDILRALDHIRALASRAESLIAAAALGLGRVPWPGEELRCRQIVRVSDLLGLAQAAALETVTSADQLVVEVLERGG